MPNEEEPDSNRRRTRPANAHAHPGKAAMEALAFRRNREDIEAEKKVRDERRETRKRKKADEQAAVIDIADFEDKMAIDDVDDEKRFPRRQSKMKSKSKNVNLKGPAVKNASEKKPPNTRQRKAAKLDEGLVTETELTDDDRPQSKKQKSSTGHPMPLRRTETYVQSDGQSAVRPQKKTSNSVGDDTPKAVRKKRRNVVLTESEEGNSQVETEDEDFTTPKALQRDRTFRRSDSNSDFVEIKGDNRSKDTNESNNGREGNWQKKSKYESDHDNEEAYVSESDLQFKSIDLAKMNKARKNKRAFRKEVEGQRELVAKQKVISISEDEIIPKHRARSLLSHSEVTAQFNEKEFRTSATSGNGVGISIHAGKETCPKSKLATNLFEDDEKFEQAVKRRTEQILKEAASGNSIQSAHPGKNSSRPNSAAVKTKNTGSLSDEDDSTERAAILQSPLKGTNRLSSGDIVKIEKSSSASDPRKSRSKGNVLDSDTLSGWNRSVVPNFLYCYLYDMSPWPSTKDIEICAQKFWNWRFGDSQVLDLAKSPSHVQLLNQKLCDIRTQSATSAITNLDIEFRLSDVFEGSDLSEDEIIAYRRDFAKKLVDDKRFIFGKYTVTPDNTIRKSQPYQGKILLRTFASSFKHIKDVRMDETDAPLPKSSKHPKTLLAIAAAAVERALSLTLEGDYDFVKSKLIPKPDPGHPTKKPTTSMLAFSETVWEPRAEFHLGKGISKLKEKDWENIMTAAANFSNAVKGTSTSKGKQRASGVTEEELELAWDTD